MKRMVARKSLVSLALVQLVLAVVVTARQQDYLAAATSPLACHSRRTATAAPAAAASKRRAPHCFATGARTTTTATATATTTTAGLQIISPRSPVLSLRGGFDGEVSALVDDAYGWCMNLGQPSALIAGAVIGTIYENIASGDLDLMPEDSKITKFKKRLTAALLISAFGLEIMSIFVTTVTGTMLLSRPLHDMDHLVPIRLHTTPLQFLRENFEFEYLTARITYLQGLMNWLASIAVSHIIPRTGESHETKVMNRFISSALFATIAIMMSFYNQHMSFHENYLEMMHHWISCIAQKYYWKWPPNLMALVYVPCTIATLYWGYLGFFAGSAKNIKRNKAKIE